MSHWVTIDTIAWLNQNEPNMTVRLTVRLLNSRSRNTTRAHLSRQFLLHIYVRDVEEPEEFLPEGLCPTEPGVLVCDADRLIQFAFRWIIDEEEVEVAVVISKRALGGV